MRRQIIDRYILRARAAIEEKLQPLYAAIDAMQADLDRAADQRRDGAAPS